MDFGNMNNELMKGVIHGDAMSVTGLIVTGRGLQTKLSIKGGYAAPLYIALFALGFANSILVDFIHKKIRDQSDVTKKVDDQLDLLFSAALGGAGLFGMLYVLAPGAVNKIGVLKLFAIGEGSEIISSYASNIVVHGKRN